MDYEIVTYNLGETSTYDAVIVWTNRETNEYISFPADESNSDYVAWAIGEGLIDAPATPQPGAVELEASAPFNP